MTIKDELTMKTPDALMNGSSMADLVTSCCPNIRDPWSVPTVDMDAIFIAIRMASFGPGMDIRVACPHCQNTNEYTLDLRTVLDRIRPATVYETPVRIGQLQFQFRPQRYRDVNQNNIVSYEQQRLVDNIIQNQELPQDEKVRLFNESFEKLRDLNLKIVANSVDSITTDDGIVVTDYTQIMEFLDNVGRDTYSAIRENVTQIIDQVRLEEIKLTCTEEACGKNFTNRLEFDQANFFE